MSYIEVEGLREFNRAVRRSTDSTLPKRIGQANKRTGQLVIDRLAPAPDPVAVGVGRGASVRASASKREVLLRVGGGHRSAGAHTAMPPWGARRVVRVGTPDPPRAHIQGTAERHVDEISKEYLNAMIDAFRPAFAEATV